MFSTWAKAFSVSRMRLSGTDRTGCEGGATLRSKRLGIVGVRGMSGKSGGGSDIAWKARLLLGGILEKETFRDFLGLVRGVSVIGIKGFVYFWVSKRLHFGKNNADFGYNKV